MRSNKQQSKEKEFAQNILTCGVQHWKYVLAGDRHLSSMKARLARAVIGGDIDIWLKGGDLVKRRELWKEYMEKEL